MDSSLRTKNAFAGPIDFILGFQSLLYLSNHSIDVASIFWSRKLQTKLKGKIRLAKNNEQGKLINQKKKNCP